MATKLKRKPYSRKQRKGTGNLFQIPSFFRIDELTTLHFLRDRQRKKEVGSRILQKTLKQERKTLQNTRGDQKVSAHPMIKIQKVTSNGGHAVAQWLWHCATNRKVAGSIPDGVTGVFH
jgi:hypothetical protein